MRYSNTAITELSAKYRSVLKKCALLNAAILLTTVVALPAGAYNVTEDTNLNEIFPDGQLTEWVNSISGKTGSLTTENISINPLSGGRGVQAWYDDSKVILGGDNTKKVEVVSAGDHAIIAGSGSEVGISSDTISLSGFYSGLYSSGSKVSLVAKDNFTIDSDNNAISAWTVISGSSYVAGSGGKIDITTGDMTVNAGGIGVGANYSQSQIAIKADGDVNITATGGSDTRAIHAGNATALESITKEDTSFVTVKANNINLTADKIGVSAMSNGYVELDGNTTINAADAILARGNSTVNINKAGDKTVKMNGNINFNYDKATSGTKVDAYVDVTLAGADSYWTGNTTASYGSGRAPDESYLTVSSSKLTLKDGAVWNATQITDSGDDTKGTAYAGLNDLIIKTGTVNIADTDRGIYVDRISATDAMFTGGPLNINESMDVSGNLDLSNGSIVNTGTITFASGSQLKAALNNSTALISGGTVTGTTALMVENGTGDAKFKMFDVDQTFDLTNSLYDVVKDTEVVGQYLLSKKSTDEIVENLTEQGATAQEAATISAIADTTVSNPVLDKITEAVQSGDVKTAAKAAKDLAPTTSQAALGISKDLVGMMANVASGRMAGLAGRAGGDVFKGGSMWVQGLFNHTKQDSTSGSEGFKANSKGIAFGIDGKLNDAVTVGLGYGYTKTDADAGNRDIDVDGNNFFAYAEYAPDAWYVNGVLNFGYGRYTEKKSPAGYTTKSKYDVYTYGANLMTGYAFESGLTPEGGLRYLLVDQKSYDDGIQKISTSNNDVLTAVLGAKYGYKVKAKDWMFTPNVRLAATYDVMSDGSKAVASITSGSSYQITGERLHRLGFEAGVGVTSTWNNWDFTLSYDGGFRKDYQSHTGTLKAKYHF